MWALLLLGFSLGLDSFRASASLGVLKLSPCDRARIVFVFGLCDGLAPLAGLAIGKSLVAIINPWAAIVGSVIVGAYGLSTMLETLRVAKDESESNRTLVAGVPIVLCLDNLAAGVGLSTLGFPVILSAATLGITSSFMSLAGLWLGLVVAHCISRRAELIGAGGLTVLGVIGAIEHL